LEKVLVLSLASKAIFLLGKSISPEFGIKSISILWLGLVAFRRRKAERKGTEKARHWPSRIF
jgi:hypothetical protein